MTIRDAEIKDTGDADHNEDTLIVTAAAVQVNAMSSRGSDDDAEEQQNNNNEAPAVAASKERGIGSTANPSRRQHCADECCEIGCQCCCGIGNALFLYLSVSV